MDVHFPHLTVGQTLRFAIACRTPHTRIDGFTRKDFEDFILDILTTVFGLRHVVNTKVGNDYVRGVSGGERKRVSISEAMAARAAIYCWDNATRGLDASTALEYTRAIRAGTNFMNNVGVVAIYQAGQNIYELFDKVTVIYAGRQVYFGTTENAKAYFEKMGYHCPSRQTTAEFLTAVTDPNGRTAKRGYENKVPQTADEFEAYWRNSPEFFELQNEIQAYNQENVRDQTLERFRAVASNEKMNHKRAKSRYLITFRAQVKLTMLRGFQRVIGNKAYTVINVATAIFQSLIIGSLFYKTTDSSSGAFSRGSVIFFALLYLSLLSLAEINSVFTDRPILMKQKTYSFYHPAAEALQKVFSDFPVKLMTILCFSIIIYFLSQLNQTAGQFFFFLIVLILITITLSGFFQMIAALTQDAQTANSIAGLAVVIFVVYTGYMIPLQSMHAWFKWLNYINPLRYAFETLMANEFHGRVMPCDNIVPRGPGYENIGIANQVCGYVGSQANDLNIYGDRYLRVAYSYSWGKAWRNYGLLFAFFLGFYAINCIATEILRPMAGGGDILLYKPGQVPDNLGEDDPIDPERKKRLLSGIGNSGEEPDIFSWQHVNYTVPVKGGTRQLLCDVQGYVKPGTMTALMGESGAGKTTLLNVLSQRISVGVITGDMLVNGRALDDSFQRRTGYVQQQDLHLSESTVREALRFAARLRQPSHIPDAEKMDYVEKIIELLGMSKYAEAFVGDVGRGLNVEQRKKLSIGVELVARPSLLLFLDEPTSGLDSQSAWAIVSFMKELAKAGQSILCTIHQPSATLFEEFDRLLMLKKGGRTVYFGDIGENSQTLVGYFERNGARKCDPAENPAEYILECIGAGASGGRNSDWGDIWLGSRECSNLTTEIGNLHETLRARPEKEISKNMKSKFAVSFFAQLKIVLIRTTLQYWRSPMYIFAKLMLMTLGGVFIGFTFFNIDNSVGGMQNGMFGIFLIQIISSPLCNQIEEYAEASRDLYEVRESQSNTFHWAALLLSQFLAELPYHLVFSTFLYIGFYFPIGYERGASVAGYFFFIYCILFQLYYVSFALMVIYFSPNAASASVITSMLFSFMVAFCGVIQPKEAMSGFWTFMWKVSPYTYFIQAYMAAVFHDRPVRCKDYEFNYLEPAQGQTCGQYMARFLEDHAGYINNPDATTGCQYCQFSIGDEFLRTVSTSHAYKWRNVGFICAFIIFNIFAMLGMYYLFRVSTWKFPDIGSLFRSESTGKNKNAPPPPSQPVIEEEEEHNFYDPQPEDRELAQTIDDQIRMRKQSVIPQHSHASGKDYDLADVEKHNAMKIE